MLSRKFATAEQIYPLTEKELLIINEALMEQYNFSRKGNKYENWSH